MSEKPEDIIKELKTENAELVKANEKLMAELTDYRKYFAGALQAKLKENKTHEQADAERKKDAAKRKAELDKKLASHIVVATAPIKHNGRNYKVGEVIIDLTGFNVQRKLDNNSVKLEKK
jgi:hypothetical protein